MGFATLGGEQSISATVLFLGDGVTATSSDDFDFLGFAFADVGLMASPKIGLWVLFFIGEILVGGLCSTCLSVASRPGLVTSIGIDGM